MRCCSGSFKISLKLADVGFGDSRRCCAGSSKFVWGLSMWDSTMWPLLPGDRSKVSTHPSHSLMWDSTTWPLLPRDGSKDSAHPPQSIMLELELGIVVLSKDESVDSTHSSQWMKVGEVRLVESIFRRWSTKGARTIKRKNESFHKISEDKSPFL